MENKSLKSQLPDEAVENVTGGGKTPPPVYTVAEIEDDPFVLSIKEFFLEGKKKGLPKELLVQDALAKFGPQCSELVIRGLANSVWFSLV
jgi:hypothetical protein